MTPALINITPQATIIEIGPIVVGWYAIAYLVGLGVMLWVSQHELERRAISREHLWSAFLLVFVLALVGGRVYHVIHEWGPIYSRDPLSAILPITNGRIGFAGLGLFGGILGAMLGIALYARWRDVPIRRGLDAVIPGTLFAQGIARWGNFFNQELYGPPTEAPWGIAIECANRIAQYPCTSFPFETTGFHPLFFYESALNIAGGFIALWLSRRHLGRLRAGDLAAFWGIWYGATRVYLETFREGWNWTLEGGLATAQLVGLALMLVGAAWLVYNHRPGRPADRPPPAAPEPRPTAPGDVALQDPPPAAAPSS